MAEKMKKLAENYHHYIYKLNLSVSIIFIAHLFIGSHLTAFLLILALEGMMMLNGIYARFNKRRMETILYAGVALVILLFYGWILL